MSKVRNIFESLKRPIGLPKDKDATSQEIEKWKAEENPGFFKSKSYLMVGGFGLGITAALTTLFALTRDSKMWKVLGTLGGGLTVGGLGLGLLSGFDDDDHYSDYSDDYMNELTRAGGAIQQQYWVEEDERRRKENFDLAMGVNPGDLNFGSGTGIGFNSPSHIIGQPRLPGDPKYFYDPDGNLPG